MEKSDQTFIRKVDSIKEDAVADHEMQQAAKTNCGNVFLKALEPVRISYYSEEHILDTHNIHLSLQISFPFQAKQYNKYAIIHLMTELLHI